MLEILDSPKYLVAIRLSADLTANDITEAYKLTEKAVASNNRVSFFIDVDPSTKFTVEGLLKDLIERVNQLGKRKKYFRAALVTDKGWMAALARVEGLVFSSMDVRVFDHSERDKALAWASEAPEALPAPVEPEPSIRIIKTNSDKVFAYQVNGRLRERDIKKVVAEMKPYLEKDGKFNVLARMEDFSGFDLMALLDDDLIRLKFKAASKLGRYAVVGPKPWMRNFLELVNSVIGSEIKAFDESEEAAAWDWIGAQRALHAE